MYADPGKVSELHPNKDGTMWPNATMGSVRARLTQNRRRNIPTLCPSWRPCFGPGASSGWPE
jgi:hypothetical protein